MVIVVGSEITGTGNGETADKGQPPQVFCRCESCQTTGALGTGYQWGGEGA